jgi:hypothetical protein
MPTSSSHADDYGVDFGVETQLGEDAGSLMCVFDQVCSAKIDSLGLRVTIDVFRSHPKNAYVYLYGRDLSCCYFADAARSITIDPHEPLSRVPFFSGRPAQGALFIQNEYAGTLYLRFRFR